MPYAGAKDLIRSGDRVPGPSHGNRVTLGPGLDTGSVKEFRNHHGG